MGLMNRIAKSKKPGSAASLLKRAEDLRSAARLSLAGVAESVMEPEESLAAPTTLLLSDEKKKRLTHCWTTSSLS
jgi:hypothetical protein